MTAATAPLVDDVRHDWTREEVESLFALPFADLMWRAQQVHRRHHDPNAVQLSQLLSIKTGGCPEDCAYCPQSSRYDGGEGREALMDVGAVVEAAKDAQARGATRFCMGAAWRSPKDKDLDVVLEMVREVKGLGLETCVTLGMLKKDQAERLREAGLDYYNHNIDTDPEHYGDIISTRQFEDRIDTLRHVKDAGMHVCCGGIVGMGEGRAARAGMLHTLATMERHPESVPINMLVQVEGTPLHGTPALDPLEFVRTIAVARVLMPRSMVRLSAGRENMDDTVQAMCFLAGANSIFYGERLLTTKNPASERDRRLFEKLGVRPLGADELPAAPAPAPASLVSLGRAREA